jgi:ATP-binding cassette, subfamily F, member 3
VTPYDGDLESYRQEALAALRQGSAAKGTGGSAAAASVKQKREDERRQSAQRRVELAPLRKQMAEHEKRVGALQKKIAAIDLALGDPAFYEQAAKAQALTQERGLLAKELKAAEEAWFEASLAYEEAASAA